MRGRKGLKTSRAGIALLALLAMGMAAPLHAQEERLDSVKVNGHMRRFKMVLPEGLKADAPLVFVLHGYGSSYIKRKTYMHDAALAHGFALCVPDGLSDPKGKRSWNVGYPQQAGWLEDPVSNLCKLAEVVQRRYKLSRQNTFLTGMSNGGDVCYLLAYQPDHLQGLGFGVGTADGRHLQRAVAQAAGALHGDSRHGRPHFALRRRHGQRGRMGPLSARAAGRGGHGRPQPLHRRKD